MIKTSAILYNPTKLAMSFIDFLKAHGLRFRVNEAGSRTIYVQVTLQSGGQVKIRFGDHGIPEYKDIRLMESRKVDLSVDPTTGKTFEDACDLAMS